MTGFILYHFILKPLRLGRLIFGIYKNTAC
jgi:hypothetical protein